MRKHLTALALVMLMLGAHATSAQAAGDDDFAASLTTSLYGSFEVMASNAAATKEADEPDHAGNAGGHSLWWTWEPAADGTITIDTCDSDFDTLLGVYTGDSIGALTEVASNDNGCGTGSTVTFSADASKDYRIAVDGTDGETGNIALRTGPPAPSNDNFASASPLSGLPAFATGTNAGATRQAGETDHAGNAGGRSVWWTWTAPSAGEVSVDTCDSDFDTLLAVYTGDVIDALTERASNDDDSDCSPGSRVTFTATMGTEYRILVDGYDRASGNIGLRLAAQAPPAPLYLALGDSVSRGFGAPDGRGFVDLYFDYLRDPSHGGLGELANFAVPGETSGSMLAAGGQMDRAIDRISQASDTRVVTLSIGGNDGRSGQCPTGFADPPCPFRQNYTVIMARLRDALAGDPGDETVQAMEYYNPAAGTGTSLEGIYEYGTLGDDGRVDCAGAGRAIGLNDQVRCIARDYAATSVDPHPTFKAGGQSLIADGVHPNAAGHAAIACLFEHPERAGSARPCDASQPPTPGPAPGRDTRPPKLTLSGPRAQRILRKRRIVVLVETDEAATVTASGTIAVPSPARLARLRPTTSSVAAHSRTKISLRLTKKRLALVRRGLRLRRVLTARIRVRVRDGAGNSSVAARRVRVTR
jgi:lysophospholipase L1-like esterase